MRTDQDLGILDLIYDPIQERLDKVEEDLKAIGQNQSPFLGKLLAHVLENTGKRIRPALTLLCSNFHPNDGQKAQIMATGVELLHVASLIHDDTVDKSDTRRGRPTVSSKWGQDTAILLGDYVFAKAVTFVCDTENIRVIRRFSDVAIELASGELEQKASVNNWSETREAYLERIYRKTASLFSSVGEAAAVLSGAPEQIVNALKHYSHNLGMAFQIIDDILDIQSTKEEVGKPVGIDLARGIMTMPAIIVAERYPNDNPFMGLFQGNGNTESKKRAVDLIRDPDIIKESYAVAEMYGQMALDHLNGLEPSTSLNSLKELVPYVVDRRS